MELHQLRYVLAVARAGSFSRAAEDLFLAQPSLSVQIRKLEKELGIALFDRLGRRVVLTAAGEEFVAHVQQALAHLDRARAGAAAVRSLQGGRVSIGVLPSVGAGLLPGVLADFRREYPDVEVRLTEHNVSAEFERMVEDGRLDLAVIRAPWARPGLVGRSIVREPVVALVPPEHPLADRSDIALVELKSEKFVAMQRDYGLRELLEQICNRAGFEPTVTVETTQLSVLQGMVASGLGVSLLPELAGAGYPVTIPIDDDGAARELGIVHRARTPLSPPAALFLELLADAAADRPARG